VATYGFDAVGSYILVVALAALMVFVLVWQPYRRVRTINVWLASGAVGILLGCSIPCALLELNGYCVTRVPSPSSTLAANEAGLSCGGGATCPVTGKPMNDTSDARGGAGKICPMTGKPIDGTKGMPSAGAGGESFKFCPMTGKPIEGTKGMPAAAAGGESLKICPMTGKPIDGTKGMPGAAAGRTEKPRPQVQLTTMVQKLALLTGDIGITLTAEQAAAITAHLKDVESLSHLSDFDAKARYDKLVAVLNDKQKASLEAIEVSFAAVPAGSSASGGACLMEDAYRNPFKREVPGKVLNSLRERLAAPAPKAETPKTPPAKAEPAKADAPKNPTAKS